MVVTGKDTEIQWIKFGSVDSASFIGKDTIVFGFGNYMLFYDTSRPEKKELIYRATNDVKGDGIQCFCTHRSVPCFAIAEKCRNPRILINAYPSFENMKTIDALQETSYMTMRFTEMEYLVALTSQPTYNIIIWNWRTLDKLFCHDSSVHCPNQILRASFTFPLQIAQAAPEEKTLVIWEMNMCYKKTILIDYLVSMPEKSQPPYQYSWCLDGDLYFSDSAGNLYSVTSDTHTCSIILECKEEGTCKPCLTWYKGGWVFARPGKIQYYRRKSPEGWNKIWSYTPLTPILNLMSSSWRESLYAWNEMHELVQFKGEPNVECFIMKSYGSNFDFVCFIFPVADFFVTYGHSQRVFNLWNKTSAAMVSNMKWDKPGTVNDVRSNPRFPYIVVVQSTGKVTVINMYDTSYIMILHDVYLTTNPLDTVRFNASGTRFCVANIEIGEFFLLQIAEPKMDILATIKLELKIVDYALVDDDTSMKLVVLPMSQLCCRSGQNILLYTLNQHKKIFQQTEEVTLPQVMTSITPKNKNELFCIPHRSRTLHTLEIHSGSVVGKKVTGHQMKLFCSTLSYKILITYGFDGLAIVRTLDSLKCITVIAPHHRMSKGIKQAIIDPYCYIIITLGIDGTLVAFNYSGTHNTKSSRNEYENLMKSTFYKQVFHAPITAAKAKARALEKLLARSQREGVETDIKETKEVEEKNWLEIREMEKINHDKVHSHEERNALIEECRHIRLQLQELLNSNLELIGPEQLPMYAFDLDKANRRKRTEDAKADKEKEKSMQLATIKARDKVSDYIKKNCWDPIKVKGRELLGIVSPVVVESYPLLDSSEKKRDFHFWMQERLKLEQYYRRDDYFEPWVPRSNSELELHLNTKSHFSNQDVSVTVKTRYEEDELEDQNKDTEGQEKDSSLLWSGTASHQFIQVNPYHYNQFEATGFIQGLSEIHLISEDIRNLMIWFNKEFEEVYQMKEREVTSIIEKNNRLRHIINELNFFRFSPDICKTIIIDPEWTPTEQPERIMTVEDYEMTVTPYISPSQQELIDKNAAELERIRLLMLADDFKEKALIAMMDGVLEKLWENEIKKDVPKPKCMLEKEPDAYTEDDLKAIRAYDEAVRFLQFERERYRKILEADWVKIQNSIKDIVKRFDERLSKLQLVKMKVESAVCQETLKLLRIRLKMIKKWEITRRENNIKEEIARSEKKLQIMNADYAQLQESLAECKTYYESLQARDRNMDKNFRREFPDVSPVIGEQLYKLSKKRPKLLQRAALFSTLLIDLGKCVIAGTKPEYLTGECIQYLKDIDIMDSNVNAPASVNDQTWEQMCKMRRAKIDCELRIRACAVELSEAESTILAYHKRLKNAVQYQSQLNTELHNIRQDQLLRDQNFDIQLVLKSGLVEIPLTGCISDFDESVLVSRDTLTDINSIIEKAGNKKIQEMVRAAEFRKGIIFKEWEHKKLRMEIEDLQSALKTVENVQVTKELQSILISRARGFTEEKGILYLEDEFAAVKERYNKNEIELNRKIEEFNEKIDTMTLKNEELDARIAELNVDVNELNTEIDKDFDEKELAKSMKRMRKVRHRSKLVRKIQEQHNEILMLQTELELLRLRTFPTLKSKP